jgi:hypothetical protein
LTIFTSPTKTAPWWASWAVVVLDRLPLSAELAAVAASQVFPKDMVRSDL